MDLEQSGANSSDLLPLCISGEAGRQGRLSLQGAQAGRHGGHIRQGFDRRQRPAEAGFWHLMGDHHDLGIGAIGTAFELHDRPDRHSRIAEAAACPVKVGNVSCPFAFSHAISKKVTDIRAIPKGMAS